MKNQRRVLIVGEFGALNGGENSLLAIVEALTKLGWEFHAAVPAETDFANALQYSGVTTHHWSVRNPDQTRKPKPEFESELAQVIQTVDPAVLHFNSLSTCRIGGPIASRLGVPALGYLRDIMKLSKKAISDINLVDRIIAVSSATKLWHVDQGLQSEKTFVVHNGVDSKTFFPIDPDGSLLEAHETGSTNIRKELGIPNDCPVFVFVGQIGMRKGVDILIQSFLDLADQLPEPHLLIIGERNSQKLEAVEYEQKLTEQVSVSDHRKRVHWLGRRSDVAEIFRASTILVHPARQEPLGRVLLEAAASGLPIITTDVGGSNEILNRADLGIDGTLIPPDNPGVLTSRMVELLASPQRLGHLGKSLRRLAIEKFSVEKCSVQINAHYLELVDGV